MSQNAGTIPWISSFTGLGDGVPTIAIIGALEKEVAQIKEELNGAHMSQEAGLTVVSGELDGLTVVATTAGMGTVNAAAATQHLISKYAPQAVVFSGIAGGLNPKLHINDVVIGGGVCATWIPIRRSSPSRRRSLRNLPRHRLWLILQPPCLSSMGLWTHCWMRKLRRKTPNSS